MYEGALGNPGTEYYMEASAENPAVMIQLFKQEESGLWEATRLYTACAMSMYVQIPPLMVEPEDSEVAMAMYDSSIGKSDEVVEDLGSFAGIGKDYTKSTKEIHRVEE
jgi:hypothetical protein